MSSGPLASEPQDFDNGRNYTELYCDLEQTPTIQEIIGLRNNAIQDEIVDEDLRFLSITMVKSGAARYIEFCRDGEHEVECDYSMDGNQCEDKGRYNSCRFLAETPKAYPMPRTRIEARQAWITESSKYIALNMICHWTVAFSQSGRPICSNLLFALSIKCTKERVFALL